MSWSISRTAGVPEKVATVVESAFDQQAKSYEGRSEQRDILDAKAAVMSWLAEAKAANVSGVMVEASGSRGATWCNVEIKCSAISLLL